MCSQESADRGPHPGPGLTGGVLGRLRAAHLRRLRSRAQAARVSLPKNSEKLAVLRAELAASRKTREPSVGKRCWPRRRQRAGGAHPFPFTEKELHRPVD